MLPRNIQQCLRADPEHGFVYLNNPKAGCSTVKANLWRGVSPDTLRPNTRTYDKEHEPFSRDVAGATWMRDAFVFTFVRNPLGRLVSTYTNKIADKSDPATWASFAKRFDLVHDAEVSFDAFVEMIAGEPPSTLNPHWRPQYINVLSAFVRPNFVGHLERMDQTMPTVLDRLFGPGSVPYARRDGHRTKGPRPAFESYFVDPATRSRALDLYQGDFARFGYLPDIARTKSVVPELSPQGDHTHEGLAALAQLRAGGPLAARRAHLKQIRQTLEAPDDPLAKDWVLYEQLTLRAPTHAKTVALLTRRLPSLRNAHPNLKQAAKAVARANNRPDLAP